ncbi:uncharacterized protein LOC129924650 [Biomphalaria glabrata]|uniref:Uncharacterized protein LOC129924650 n=1 Tax=Biomphalaria glabrata TaxID=6526 RepID=A0A9W2ZQE2_BIOGL|nr:uncharacterized protein LOC129924650 [Biomphalaria glabrata]
MAPLSERPSRLRSPARAEDCQDGLQRPRVQDQGDPPNWRHSAVSTHLHTFKGITLQYHHHSYDDEAVEEFYDQLQEVVNKVPKKDILVVQGDWNAKVGSDYYQTWKGTCGKYSNLSTNERGQRLLEFAKYNNLLLANTLGCHKKSRINTWRSSNGEHHNQIDYIMVQQRFKTSINTAKTRSFPGADIGSDHDLVMMTLKVHLKKVTKQGPTRIKLDLDKLKDPQVAAIFEAQVGRRFAALNILDSNEQDIDTQVNMLNTAVTDTALEILGKLHPLKKPWVTEDILQLCDKRRELKGKKLSDPKYVHEYKSVNKRIRKGMKEAKKKWIENKCQEKEQGLNRNNSKKAYQLVKDPLPQSMEEPTQYKTKTTNA